MNESISEEKALEILMNNYFPKEKISALGNEKIICLDAMCGAYWHGEIIYDFLSRYKNAEIFGADIKNIAECKKKQLIDSKKPIIFEKKNILDIKKKFDLILTLRPNCNQNLEMIPVYSRLNSILNDKGMLFAATYTKPEIESLQMILESAGFNSSKPSQINECKLKYGYAIWADKS